MEYTWIFKTSAGFLILLKLLHICFFVAWMMLNFQSQKDKIKLLAFSFMTILTGALLVYFIPMSWHTSWGYSILVGSLVTFLMLVNQICDLYNKLNARILNLTLGVLVIFLMILASHAGFQISSSGSIVKVVGMSFLPTLLFEIIFIKAFVKNEKNPSVFSLILMVIALLFSTYFCLEYFSK